MSKLIKKYNGDFTQFSNKIFRANLPLKTIGLFALMWSLPNNWNFTVKGLSSLGLEGESLVKKSIKELEEKGFLKRKFFNDEKGYKRVDYELFDTPRGENPTLENPTCENPTLEKQLYYKEKKELIK